jgi:hypothetical protein
VNEQNVNPVIGPGLAESLRARIAACRETYERATAYEKASAAEAVRASDERYACERLLDSVVKYEEFVAQENARRNGTVK